MTIRNYSESAARVTAPFASGCELLRLATFRDFLYALPDLYLVDTQEIGPSADWHVACQLKISEISIFSNN